jgi:Outer membrane efflux protein
MQQGFKAPMKQVVVPALLSLLVTVGWAQNIRAQEMTPSALPGSVQEIPVPKIAPHYRGQQKPLPELGRVGVDMTRQHPLSLRDALAMALENNKDIEVARHNVKIAEFDLLGAQGAYDPRFNTTAFYERIKTPISNFFSASGGTFEERSQLSYRFLFCEADNEQFVYCTQSAISHIIVV